MIEVVFAQANEKVPLPSGRVANVHKGQHWPATDPVVLLRPDLFTDDPRFGLLYTEAPPGHDEQLNELDPAAHDRDSADDAEQASAAPGERRNVRRPRS